MPYDYTANDNPVDDPDNFVMPDAITPNRTADQIAEENSFRDIAPGERLLYVKGFVGRPEEKRIVVYLDGAQTAYTSASVEVIFGEVNGAVNATVRDRFHLPPSDPREYRAYYEGCTKEEDKKGGFMANKFLHFLDRIGFPFPPGGHLPPQARVLGSWKNRQVRGTVTPGKPYTDKKGEAKPGYNQIKLFSYEHASTPTQTPRADGEAAARPPLSGRPSFLPPAQPAAVAAALGLDTL